MNHLKLQTGGAMIRLPLYLTAFVLACSNSLGADDWTSFRNGGNSHSGSPLPKKWSPEKGIAWQRELVGYGQSAPVIIDNKVFVTSVEGPMCEKLVVQCFNLSSGELQWQFDRDASIGHPSNYMNSRAAPTPLVDQNSVYAFFETGDFVCLDHAGSLQWHRNEAKSFGRFENNHGIGSSPAMDEENLYLLIEHDGPSSVTAINKKSGETVWQTDRSSTKSWASPIVTNVDGGQRTIVISSGGTVAGYAASDGTELWEIDGFEGNSVPSPTSTGSFLLVGARLPEFANDGQVHANCCLDLSKMTGGSPEVRWRADKAICDYASPVAANGYAYFLNKANVLHCIDVVNGEVAYRKRLSLNCWATPIVSDDAIYFFGKNGQTRVVRGGTEFVEIADNRLWNADTPPSPETYVEATGSHGGHGGHGSASHGSSEQSEAKQGGAGHRDTGDQNSESQKDRAAGPGAGMVQRMLAGDVNKDGVLEGDEIPAMFRQMVSRIDLDGDSKINRTELEAMAKSFAERRKNAAASARDPIVYGVAAAGGKIAVRTGTRLYVIDGK